MFKIQFETSNSAFDDGNSGTEIERILHDVAAKAQTIAFPGGEYEGPIYDANGNAIGNWSIKLAAEH